MSIGFIRDSAYKLLCILLVIAVVSCNMGYTPVKKQYVSEEEIKSVVSNVLDTQLEYVQPVLEENEEEDYSILRKTKGGMISGSEVVTRTLSEDSGSNYINFCYSVNDSSSDYYTNSVLESAHNVMSDEEYEALSERVQSVEKSLYEYGSTMAKGLPADQQEAFFKDLKSLIIRTVVLLTAGIVYAVVPEGVFWGKVSAAAAISIGAGLVSATILSLYENYKFGDGITQDSFSTWLKELIKIPKAEYAVATSIISIGTTLNKGPVVAGICVCVFSLFDVLDKVRTMLKTYNFDA